MQVLTKALVVSGLVLMTGPLCFVAQAQDYVDVEAERAATATSRNSPPASSSPSPASSPAYTSPPATDPYSPQPTRSYPATSYGVNSPTANTQVAPAAAVSPQATGGDQNISNLLFQLQQLQQEVMMLNGKVEEQAHELRRLKEQSLERYVDLDKRVSSMGGGAAVVVAGGTAAGGETFSGNGGSGSNVPEQAGEAEAYRAAYALVRGQQFDQAVGAFTQFLNDYPGGKYAANAHYWLGELYLVVDPQDLEGSRQAFTLLLSQYPDNPKVPDALYKLGKVHYMKGNREKGKEYFDQVIREYGSSNSSAAKLAKEFLAENY
jgi:tol-pal system protein YbgF